MLSSNNYPSFAHLLQAIGVDEAALIEKATEIKWFVRKHRKITLMDLLEAIYKSTAQVSPSYNDIASAMDVNDGDGPSRQAVAKRMDEKCRKLFKHLLQKAFEHKLTVSLPFFP